MKCPFFNNPGYAVCPLKGGRLVAEDTLSRNNISVNIYALETDDYICFLTYHTISFSFVECLMLPRKKSSQFFSYILSVLQGVILPNNRILWNVCGNESLKIKPDQKVLVKTFSGGNDFLDRAYVDAEGFVVIATTTQSLRTTRKLMINLVKHYLGVEAEELCT